MEGKVSRRNFVSAAGVGVGAGLLLTACNGDNEGTAGAAQKKDNNANRGGGDGWGEHPDKKGKNHLPQSGNNKVPFEPKYICLVYIQMVGAQIRVEHAFFPIVADPAKFAKEAFVGFSGSGWPTGATRPSKDFLDFNFHSQQKIFFFVDNGADITFDDKFLISFTQFGADTGRPKWDHSNPAAPVLTKPKSKHKNNAFFDAVIIEPNLMGLDNWFTTKDNKKFKLGDPEEAYSMNIHLLMKTSAGGTVPIIIDPNTGNGAGNEP